jgi:hypothetical protein
VENNNILSEDLNLSDQKNAESLQGQLLSQFINNVTDLDSHLVAAFETMLQQDVVADTEQDDVLNCGQNFLILSGLILDPMCPFSNKVEGSLAPVVHCHTDRACRRLVHLFRETLEMEQVCYLAFAAAFCNSDYVRIYYCILLHNTADHSCGLPTSRRPNC